MWKFYNELAYIGAWGSVFSESVVKELEEKKKKRNRGWCCVGDAQYCARAIGSAIQRSKSHIHRVAFELFIIEMRFKSLDYRTDSSDGAHATRYCVVCTTRTSPSRQLQYYLTS